MSTIKDAVGLAKDARELLRAVRAIKASRRKRVAEDSQELALLRKAAKQLAELLKSPPSSADTKESEDVLKASIALVDERIADPEVQQDDAKLLKLIGARSTLRSALGRVSLRKIFDTSELLPVEELESIRANVVKAQEAIAQRAAVADAVRIGLMVVDLTIKVAVGVAKAV